MNRIESPAVWQIGAFQRQMKFSFRKSIGSFDVLRSCTVGISDGANVNAASEGR